MSLRAYSEINLHVVWRVKGDAPVLRDTVEAQLHRYLWERAAREADVRVHALGGTDNHVHLAVSVPPTLLISKWVGELKGGRAHFINHEIVNRKVLEWQTGYGVLSFGSKDLPWVVEYIQKQREHHARAATHDRLERAVAEEQENGAGKPAEAG